MVEPYTGMGGNQARFPSTRWSIIRDSADRASPTFRESLEQLASIYWRPIYAYFRRKWGKSNDEAKDLTQEFFVAVTEKEMLQSISPDRGKFRSYVMGALDNFARLQRRREGAQKRGGRVPHCSLHMGEGFDPPAGENPEQTFTREWASAVLTNALQELEKDYLERGMESTYRMFVLREVDPPVEGAPSYEELANQFGLTVTDVRNYLYRARKALKKIVMNKVTETVTGQGELEQEMKELFGSWDD